MKKLLAILLTVAMMLALVACGGGTSAEKKEKAAGDNGETDAPEEEIVEFTFTEMVAIDNDECKVTIKGIEIDEFAGLVLKTELENKSDSKSYMFAVEYATVNGLEHDPFFASTVDSGKKANEKISFDIDELAEVGIDSITDICIAMRVYDSDDILADEVAEESFHVYPFGEDSATVYVREEQEDDNVILDNDYATVIVTGYEVDDIWGYTANLYIINKSDKNLMVSAEDVSVNDIMADPYYATDVIAGTSKFSKISWSESTFEENDITEVETIEFTLEVSDADDWMADDYANEEIILNP